MTETHSASREGVIHKLPIVSTLNFHNDPLALNII